MAPALESQLHDYLVHVCAFSGRSGFFLYLGIDLLSLVPFSLLSKLHGMEIACLMRSSIPGTCVNLLVLERFKAIISENYTEPKEETILESFLVPTKDESVGATNDDIGVR